MSSHVRKPGRFQTFVTKTSRRLDGHVMLLGLLVAGAGAVLAYIGWASTNGVPFQDRYLLKAQVPANAPIVQKGDAVRIAGRLAGLVTDVQPDDGFREVTMELRPAYSPVGENATATVRVKSIVYLTYVELRPGDLDDPIPDGGTIPVEQSGSNVDLLEVVELFDRRARETLQSSIYNAGIAFAGRGRQLNAMIRDLPEILEDGTPIFDALTPRAGALARFISGAAATTSGLEGERGDDVAASLTSGSEVVGTIAAERTALAETIELLRPFEDEFLKTAPVLDPLLEDAISLSETLNPAVEEVAAALPDLNRTLALGDELRLQTARLTGFLIPVLRKAIPVLAALEPTVASIDPLREPLRKFTNTLDSYAEDVKQSALNVLSATGVRYPEGGTAGGQPALRFGPVFTCHQHRNPYPEPGTAGNDREGC